MGDPTPYGRIFRRSEKPANPFVNTNWDVLLFVELLPRHVSPYFEPLGEGARRIGDAWVLVADERDPDRVLKCAWNPDEYARAVFQFPLGALVYGESSRWGMVVTDEAFACLGGEPEFIEHIERALGGREAVRQEFESWLRTVEGLLFSSEKAAALRRLNRWVPGGRPP